MCFFEIKVHLILSNWFRFSLISFVNIILIFLFFNCKSHPFKFLWIVIGCIIVSFLIAPTFLQSSFAIIALYLCYTLLPLQLKASAFAAFVVTLSAFILYLYNHGLESKAVIFFLIFFKK